MSFLHEDFLLHTAAARRLYHDFARAQPILDYHCHLPPADLAANRQFKNLYEIWLEGDHYKWRAMRANGVAEELCTGSGDPYDKFLAWARTVPHTLRNPLYHWTHLELQRYFGIELLLNEQTAPEIWCEAERQLARPELTAGGILQRFDVRAVCTTDDPAEALTHHEALSARPLAAAVFPTYRPDKALAVDQPAMWNDWVDRLGDRCGITIDCWERLLDALRQRHDDFHALGGRLSDHGLSTCYATPCETPQAEAIYHCARSGGPVTAEQQSQFGGWMMRFFGRLDVEKQWTKQLHIGAFRNTRTHAWQQLGPDTGFDSIGDAPHGSALRSMLDHMDQADALPKTVLYNLNPADNYLFATMAGNFQGGGIPGKMQFGSGWWFLDQKEGMEWQINALSNLGLLSRFIGMLTDSRSFMSYPRHEYFRRVLCNLLGQDMERRELPADFELMGDLVRRICFANARDYLQLPLPTAS